MNESSASNDDFGIDFCVIFINKKKDILFPSNISALWRIGKRPQKFDFWTIRR